MEHWDISILEFSSNCNYQKIKLEIAMLNLKENITIMLNTKLETLKTIHCTVKYISIFPDQINDFLNKK